MGLVLVGCECSGEVRRAFRALGHDAWSCDLKESEDGADEHIRGDVRDAVESREWDLLIAHPPCTRLALSGNRWRAGRENEVEEALDLVRWLLVGQRVCRRVCVENPIGLIGSRVMPASQIIHPWQHGHPERKKTGLWLRNLPDLEATEVVPEAERNDGIWNMRGGRNRGANRARTFRGVARAMAAQWGCLI